MVPRARAHVVLVLAVVSALFTGGVACGSRQHIPLDAPQYEDPVGPATAGSPNRADAGTTVPRS